MNVPALWLLLRDMGYPLVLAADAMSGADIACGARIVGLDKSDIIHRRDITSLCRYRKPPYFPATLARKLWLCVYP